ncbi:hypothetical protein LINPERPRIM_LOCUS22459 [Linum perenne]
MLVEGYWIHIVVSLGTIRWNPCCARKAGFTMSKK